MNHIDLSTALDRLEMAGALDAQSAPWLLKSLDDWEIDVVGALFENVPVPPKPPLEGTIWKTYRERSGLFDPLPPPPLLPVKEKAWVYKKRFKPSPPPRRPKSFHPPTKGKRLVLRSRFVFERVVQALARNGFTKTDIGTYTNGKVVIRTLSHTMDSDLFWIERTPVVKR